MAKATNRTPASRAAPSAPTRPGVGARPPEVRRPRRALHPAAHRKVVRTRVALSTDGAPPPSGQPRRFLTTLCFLLILVGMLLLGRYFGAEEPTRASAPRSMPATTTQAATARAQIRAGTDSADTARPTAGTSGQFTYVGGFGPVLGGAGPIRRFRVAVEKPASSRAAADFANEVNRTLGDARSWIAGRQFRLQRVPASAHAEFTIYLASAATSRRMCFAGGLETGGYTSCRLPRQVIINDSRWENAVPGYRAPVATYRAYAINHEVGHQLGHGHEGCPGKGRPAPVMMQQTLGLKGCVANSWPYLNGKRYAGPPTP